MGVGGNRSIFVALTVMAFGMSFGHAGSASATLPEPDGIGAIVVTDEVMQPSPTSVAVGMEDVNHEIYGGIYSQMIFGEAFAEPAHEAGISGMWRATADTAALRYDLIDAEPFKGRQSQRLSRATPGGWVGVENRGLNRQGLAVVGGKAYEGIVALRAERALPVRVSLQSADGGTVYAAHTLTAQGEGWQTYSFALTSSASDRHARFAIEIGRPGTLDIGYAFVQPGAWGRFRNVPVRADVGQALIDQGVQAIRFGGCANGGCGDVSDYKWKSMIGDPVRRPVTKGFWYPYESNGFGIFEFLQLGEALGVEAVPSLNIDESPADIRDLMEYLYGAASTEWGARRVADGHPAPYQAHRFQLGNEEAVDATYFAKFKALADVIWAYDPAIRLVVGDFTYYDVITEPFAVTGARKTKTLAAHQQILELAAKWKAEVDFDVHLWTRTPKDGGWDRKQGDIGTQVAALDSYAAALRRIGPKDARFKIVVFELNANSHDLTRALANAEAITALQKRPYLDVVSSANAFQVDGHNDNGWDQGLIFMSQDKVWVQPPYDVHRMIAASQRANVVRATVSGDSEDIEATGFRDGSGASLNVVNTSDDALSYDLDFGRSLAGRDLVVTALGNVRGTAVNTYQNPANIMPRTEHVRLNAAGRTRYTLPPRSFVTLRTAD